MNENIIELKNIYKTYQTKNEKLEVLVDINYSFEKGKLYAIKGHSGSGKSTLVKILGLIDKANKGDYLLFGKKVDNISDNEKSLYRLKHIGFIFQDYNLNPYLKAEENISVPMIINKAISKSTRKEKIKKLLTKVGLENRAFHFPNELSGGEQQRIAIARALVNNPDIIIADEPTGNLDKANEKIIFSLLKALVKDGKCIIVVSHSDEIMNYADKCLLLENGKIVEAQND